MSKETLILRVACDAWPCGHTNLLTFLEVCCASITQSTAATGSPYAGSSSAHKSFLSTLTWRFAPAVRLQSRPVTQPLHTGLAHRFASFRPKRPLQPTC
jgi:hypothetical protein